MGEMKEEDKARVNLYWKARDLLNEYISLGFESKEDILEELEDDLEEQ